MALGKGKLLSTFGVLFSHFTWIVGPTILLGEEDAFMVLWEYLIISP